MFAWLDFSIKYVQSINLYVLNRHKRKLQGPDTFKKLLCNFNKYRKRTTDITYCQNDENLFCL